MTFRISSTEKDLAGFISGTITETGAMVISSAKGRFDKPILCQSEDDVIINAGYPSASYPETFEAIAFVRSAPLYMVCPFYEVQSKFGGVHVFSGSVAAFTGGNINPNNYLYTTDNTKVSDFSVGTGNGITTQFSGTLAYTKVDEGSLIVKIAGVEKKAGDTGAGVISGDDIAGTGTNVIDYTGGGCAFNFLTAPASGSAVTVSYLYEVNKASTISHSFFAVSPYTDDLAVSISSVSGYEFKMTLYSVSAGTYTYLTEYSYSLIREKDGYGKSLYIDDVFKDNPYLIPKVNSACTFTAYSIAASTVALSGGRRVAPRSADNTTAWNFFQKAGKYPVKIFMDTKGGYATAIRTLIQTYQPYSFGIGILSISKDASELVTERQGLSLDSDTVALYANWALIQDPYNNSESWISNIGSVGKTLANMAVVYDSYANAGINENSLGGQLSDWTYLEMDQDFTEADLQTLDEAQINPIIFDESYGVMIYGDKTAQVSLSDTSFIGARRAYNYLIDQVQRHVLKKQVFKNNDDAHRTKARIMIDDFIASTLGAVGAFREWAVICDDSNNTDRVLELRQFIVDVYVKITPTSEFVKLRLTRLSQTAVLAELISGTV